MHARSRMDANLSVNVMLCKLTGLVPYYYVMYLGTHHTTTILEVPVMSRYAMDWGSTRILNVELLCSGTVENRRASLVIVDRRSRRSLRRQSVCASASTTAVEVALEQSRLHIPPCCEIVFSDLSRKFRSELVAANYWGTSKCIWRTRSCNANDLT